MIRLSLPAVAVALLLLVAPHAGAQQCTMDVHGADDEPGQKDLDEFCIGGTCGTAGQTVIWNFDDTRWSGNNTGDACALFDSDGDGNANYAVCATFSGGSSNGSTPPALSSTVCYQCGDTRPDRCTSSVSVACTAACTGSRPADPFAGLASHSANKCAGPNCTTLDARASCCIKPSEFGGTAVLTDVCSYPSMQPNSDPSDCIVTTECTSAADCNDNNPCTSDVCDAAVRVCRHPSAPSGTACGDSTSSACSAPDTCDGAGVCRRNDAPSTTQCRAASGACDIAEFCDGAGSCPTNGFKPSGSACGDPTSTLCNGADTCDSTGTCRSNVAANTVVCRSANGQCDAAETCDGAGNCPADAFKPSGSACGDPTSTTCNGADTCDAVGVCRTNVAATTVQCRAAASACDMAEFCDGAGNCPANALKPSGSACGDSTNTACNGADTCDAAGTCKTNLASSGTACGDPTNTVCNGADTCDGAGACKTNLVATTVQCRAASGTCDVAEFCDGAGNCPANGFKASGTACGDPTSTTCNGADTCDGVGACKANLAPTTVQCRAAASACDMAEFCDGAGNCPANAVKPSGSACGDSTNTGCNGADTCDSAGNCGTNVAPSGTACGDPTSTVCNGADTCDGSGTCRTNVAANTVVCRSASGQCDVAETCDGAGNCPANGFKATGTTCGDPTSTVCNGADTCDGSGTCRANVAANTVVCRSASGQCDVAETCDGAGTCPANGFKASGTACGDSTNTVCNGADTCDGTGTCRTNFASNTVVCRMAAGQCDAAENCDGAGTCPADAQKPNGSSCNDGNACTGPNNTDTCQNGVCGGPPRVCNDGNVCTDDACDATTGCTFTNDDSNACSDGNACTVGDHCSAGTCASAPRDCDDQLFCNGLEGCNAATGCTAGTPPACGDGFACTSDSCSEALKRCVNEPDDAVCDDDSVCSIDKCVGAGGDADGCTHESDTTSESDSRAWGLSVKSLGLYVVAPTPDTDDAFPSNQVAQIAAPPLATVDLLAVSDAATSDANGADATATAETAKISLVQQLTGALITARTVKAVSTCSADASAATCTYAGSTLTSVKVAGQNLGTITNPTTVSINTVLVHLTVAFLEQVPSGGNVPGINSAGLAVNAIHVFGTIAGGVQAIDIVVAHAEAEAAFGDATTCEPHPHVSGEAYVVGLDVDEPLLDPKHELVDGKALDVVLPSSGGTEDATQATVGPLGYNGTTLVSSATAVSHTTGTVDDGANEAQSSSYAQVEGLRLADGPLTPALLAATLVRAECAAAADGGGAASTGDSTIAGISLLGIPLCDALHLDPLCDPPPNTVLLNAPLGTLIRLNEQRCENGGTLANGCADGSVPGATGITVNAIHVYVLAFPNLLGLHADLIVSSAHCDAGAVN